MPGEEELSALPPGELAARLAEACQLIGELAARNEQLAAQNEQLAARVGQLERLAAKDSSTSSRPPSSDNPYKKKSRDRSLRERGKRRPGKQPGDPGTTMNLVDDPDETIPCPPPACCGCGADLAGAPVTAQRRHQVTDIEPAPAPKITEYVAQAKECAGCGTVTAGELPAHVRARASYGPETCAQAANLVSGHYIPVYRSTLLLCQLAGIQVSSGWMAGIRGKAAALVEASGFMEHIRALLQTAPAVHADETPGPRRRRDPVCAPGLHPLPHAPAHRGSLRRRHRRRPGAARICRHHRPRRLHRLCAPDRRAARLVRSAPAARPEGPV